MTPPVPELPAPMFLERSPGADEEVRAWVAAAQEAITSLHEAVVAATARAEDAERRLGEATPSSSLDAPRAPGMSADRTDPGSPVAEAQARFQAATDAAAAVMVEARAILQEARAGLNMQDPAPPARSAHGPPLEAPRSDDTPRPSALWGPNGASASPVPAADPRVPLASPPSDTAATPGPDVPPVPPPATAYPRIARARTEPRPPQAEPAHDAEPGPLADPAPHADPVPHTKPEDSVANTEATPHALPALPAWPPSQPSRPGLARLLGRRRRP